MELIDFIKLHRAQDNAAETAAIQKLYHEDKMSQEANAGALKAHRAEVGQVAVKCPKCGVESVLDAKRPAKAPTAKCGAMNGPVKDGIQAACGADLQ
jgi:hypothetical protein